MSRDKLRRVIVLLQAEARAPASRTREVVAKLRELAALYEQDCGAARPLDRGLLRALDAMHARLAEPWTVATLARLAGMSRATFARKFAAAFGGAPLRHLHEQRMEQAAARLAESDEPLAAVAAAVGYQSEWAFNRAFKRHHGVAPGVFRRRIATTTTTAAPLARPARPQMSLARAA